MTKFAGSLVHFPQMEIGIGIAHFQARQLIHFYVSLFLCVGWKK